MAAGFHSLYPEYRFSDLCPARLRTGLRDYDRRNGYRGPVAKLETLEAWWEEIVKIDSPSDLRPWLGGCIVGRCQ